MYANATYTLHNTVLTKLLAEKGGYLNEKMMDGEGGCCTAPYVGGVHDNSKVNRIMLRFRPIAPRPTTGGSVSSASATENGYSYLRPGRRKRRYVRDREGNSINKRLNNRKRKVFSEETDPSGKISSCGSVSARETVVTLSLLPESPDRKDSPARGSSSSDKEHSVGGVSVMKKSSTWNLPIWLSFDDDNVVKESHVPYGVGHLGSGLDQPVWWVGSYVMVECLTDTWVDDVGLGSTDEERMMCLDGGTCPWFISDCLNRVKWANRAYRELLAQGEQPLMVWLGMKEGIVLPVVSQAFTCRVRVTYWKEKSSLTLPCDVWRMDGGGLAWRLDVKAALSLGR